MVEKTFQFHLRDTKEYSIFKGIIYYLQTRPDAKISNDLNVFSSSVLDTNARNQSKNVILYDDLGRRFFSGREKNSWICFDFMGNRVIPTDYTIRILIVVIQKVG
ncbi:hypothetical protein M9Y10_033764 [Tritrichomonas musculus]|uniref:Uncharacterized protein n=1 Tax=Tritrichomonas musculus TaxID=1915356 RepID=A0ABR2KF09_9EUKA